MISGGDRPIKSVVGDVSWEILPGCEDGIGPLLEELGKPGGGHGRNVIRDDKEGATIFTVKTNRPGLAGELFVKVYRRKGLAKMFGSSRFSSPAAREWYMAQQHQRRGLPVAAHLARGVRKGGAAVSEEYLVQESLTAYESFDQFFRTTFRPELPGVKPGDKRRLIRELADLVRRMHDRGISRPHIEPRNIMAAPRSGGGVRFVFRDLERSKLRKTRRGFSIDDRVLELARFHLTFSPLFSQGYRIRFYREYFSRDRLEPGEFQELVKRIVDLSGRIAKKDEPRIGRAVKKRSHPYFWFKAPGMKVYLVKPVYQNSLYQAIQNLDPELKRARVKVKTVSENMTLDLVATRRGRDGADGPGSAKWGFMMSAILEHHGIRHFRAMAATEPDGGEPGWILTTSPGKGVYSLAEYLARRVAEEFSGMPWDRKFLIRIARFSLALHEAGWCFKEPKGDDLWVRYTEDGTHELMVLNLADLERLPGRKADVEAQLKNLFDLWCALPISQGDGLLLAEEYTRFHRSILAAERKRWRRKFLGWQIDYSARDQRESRE